MTARGRAGGRGRRGEPAAGAVVLSAAAALFFVSGAAALVLETLWIRLFALSFGTTGLAMATVLTAYMAGLALGAGLGGRLADRLSNPGRLLAAYAAMEVVVALFAVAMPSLRELAATADRAFEGLAGGSMAGLSLARFALSTLVLLVPTTFMGATLPVLARAVTGRSGTGRLAERAGLLYASNTAGAVLGAAATPFLLLPAFGVTGTGLAVALADLAVAGVALAMARRAGFLQPAGDRAARSGGGDLAGTSGSRAEGPARASPGAAERLDGRTAAFALAGVGLSGALAMVYQQVWARTLTLVIGSSVYAVSIILALFLLGLASGAAIYSRRTASRPGQASNLAVMHVMVAIWSVATLGLADQLPAAFVLALPITGTSAAAVLGAQVLLAAAVVLPPTFFMGMTFPASLRLVELGAPSLGPGRATGRTYAANTVGAIVGSFAGGFLAIPALGAQGALLGSTLASLGLAAGYGLLSGISSGRRRALAPLAAACLVGALLGFSYRPWNLSALSSGVFRVSRSAELASSLRAVPVFEPAADSEGLGALGPWVDRSRSLLDPRELWDDGLGARSPAELLSHEAGLTATVAVTETRASSLLPGYDFVSYSLRVNGKADASLTVLSGLSTGEAEAVSPQGDAETQVLSGVLAYLLHPGRPRSALVIGWGSGMTAGAALSAGLERVRAVEIEREVVRGSAPFQAHAGFPLQDGRLELVEDDGRRLLASRPDRYDLIVSEPSNPWITGCSNLFTVEFFTLVASRLAPDGRFLQWVQAYEISPETLASILAALDRAFGSVQVFRPSHSPSDLLLVASRDGGAPSWDLVERRLGSADLAARLRVFGVLGPEDLAARLEADDREVGRVAARALPNSDDNLLVELAAPFDLVRRSASGADQVLAELGVVAPDRLALMRDAPADAASRLAEARARLGRDRPAPAPAPSLLAFAGSEAPEPVRRALAEPTGRARLSALAAALGHPAEGREETARGLALLGLAAAEAGDERLAVLLLSAHLRSAAEPAREVRAALARAALEAGHPYAAWRLAR